MWTTVYMTKSIDTAKAMREKIENCHIIVMMRRIKEEDNALESCYEILVPNSELKEALDIIIDE